MTGIRYTVRGSARIGAPAARVYDILSDYHNGHPFILPANFRNLQVERGGRGAGTVTRFEVRAFGQTQSVHHVVEEPEPGRVLVERDVDGPNTTTFTVSPDGDGQSCVVTIESTMMTARDGILGAIERAMSSSFLRRLYRKELSNLDAFARQRQ